jgi:hypothetical protein
MGRLHPYLKELITQRRTWKQPKPKREPVHGDIFDALHAKVTAERQPHGKTAAIFDWLRLGAFTGSRLSEYGQDKVAKGERWATIPTSSDVPLEWRGKPIAFIADDFLFLDKTCRIMSHSVALLHPQRVLDVHIRFRYDKGKINFIIRKFRRTLHFFLCAVESSLSIIQRAHNLQLLQWEPLGQFALRPNKCACVQGSDVAAVLQQGCILAYPDPRHHCRQLINLLQSHSIRITAAVALFNAGVSLDDIAHRLRWNSDAIKLYIRDCSRLIGTVTQQVIYGAYLKDKASQRATAATRTTR